MTQKWDIDEADAIYWICPEAAYSLTEGMRKIYGFGFDRNVVILEKNKPFKWCLLSEELLEIGNKCVEKFRDKDFRQRIRNGFIDTKNILDIKINEYKTKNLASFSAKELFEYLELFTESYKANFSYGFFAEPFDFVFPKKFTDVLEPYSLSNQEIADLSAAPELSYLNIENINLIKIALKQQNGQDISKDLKKHYDNYEWIATGHPGKKKIGLEYFEKRMVEFEEKPDLAGELDNLENFEAKIKAKKKLIIEKYNFSSQIIELIQIADEIGPLHDKRKELFVKTIFYADDVREELGRRFKYSLNELQLFELKDLLPLLEGRHLGADEIEKRREYILLDVDRQNRRFAVYSGKEAKQQIDKEFGELEEIHDEIEQLEGMCASHGQVTGEAKVIFRENEHNKMNVGNILVTGMTRPEMLPIMKKAGAIVTDEGGITCHAAIISRELGIPCIIGTKIATKVLKDRDLVEVDANKGVVRIIPPANKQ